MAERYWTLVSVNDLFPDMWENIALPDVLVPYKTEIVRYILQRCGALSPAEDTPALFIQFVNNWFAGNSVNFGKMYNALMSEYNPIENYDRTEDSERHDKFTAGVSVTAKGSSENKISAMNTDGYQNDNKTDVNNTQTNSGENKDDNRYHSRVHGNIGVTTSQQMINQELELRKFNLFEYIAVKFEDDLMIRVY